MTLYNRCISYLMTGPKTANELATEFYGVADSTRLRKFYRDRAVKLIDRLRSRKGFIIHVIAGDDGVKRYHLLKKVAYHNPYTDQNWKACETCGEPIPYNVGRDVCLACMTPPEGGADD